MEAVGVAPTAQSGSHCQEEQGAGGWQPEQQTLSGGSVPGLLLVGSGTCSRSAPVIYKMDPSNGIDLLETEAAPLKPKGLLRGNQPGQISEKISRARIRETDTGAEA